MKSPAMRGRGVLVPPPAVRPGADGGLPEPPGWTRTTVAWLAAVTIGLVALGASTLLVERLEPDGFWAREFRDSWVRLFSLDREGNVPTWFSSLLLASCALLAGLRSRSEPWRGHWRVLAIAFLALSMDEAAAIHEMSLKPIRAVFDPRSLLYYVWIVPAAGLLLAAVPFFWSFLRALAPSVRRRMVLGAAVLATGSLGVEAVTGLLMDRYGPGLRYELTTIVEEGLEMLGMTLMLSGLLLEWHRSRAQDGGGEALPEPLRSPTAQTPSMTTRQPTQAARSTTRSRSKSESGL